MPRLGRIIKVRTNVYRDLDTGRFLSLASVAPILSQARFFGTLGALKSARTRGEGFSLSRAAETTALVHGLDIEDVEERIANFKAAYDEAKLLGEDLPDFGDFVYP